ncbi:hypothetical protein, partial [Corynebacterium mendelii]|uniref:hypothetical protein n=1 Tax=Corynebacterium mendelii TaxID=2765362 RepID=UPI001A91FAEE
WVSLDGRFFRLVRIFVPVGMCVLVGKFSSILFFLDNLLDWLPAFGLVVGLLVVCFFAKFSSFLDI